MTDERARDPEPSTADIASAAEDVRRQRRQADREVDLRDSSAIVDDYNNGDMRLLPDEVVDDLRPRWADIQASFVDAPRRAVEQADALVADAIQRLAEAFAQARSELEHDWDRGEEVSTEDLRLALRRYRTFFDRLLHT